MKADEPSPDAREIASAIRQTEVSTEVLNFLAEGVHSHVSATNDASRTVADAIRDGFLNSFVSPAEFDRAGKPAGLTDGLFAIARALERIAEALEGRKP